MQRQRMTTQGVTGTLEIDQVEHRAHQMPPQHYLNHQYLKNHLVVNGIGLVIAVLGMEVHMHTPTMGGLSKKHVACCECGGGTYDN